jgi:phosphomannomutase
MSETLSCFKAYDIRGRVPDELNEDVAYRIGRAYADFIKPEKVIVGYDIRLSSPGLCEAVSRGLMDGGANVYDIGQCGTEEVYFATFHLNMDGGIMVTASHNPIDYNGMKLVREKSMPVSGDTGLDKIRELAESGNFSDPLRLGEYHNIDPVDSYVQHLLSYIDTAGLKPLKIVVNPGNGGAGKIIDDIEAHLPFEFIRIHFDPDGTFPNGIPNPLLPENRSATSEAVREYGADFGIAWDGDFDRCFLFDEQGRFIEGYYIVGLLAEAFLQKNVGAKIIHDPRLTWNTIDVVKRNGGMPIQSKTGHAFIKERMRLEDAIYGGEMSAHHYFRDFAYCDSGMIPWLLVAELISLKSRELSELVDERVQAYPCSGEINFRVVNSGRVIERIRQKYASENPGIDETDGLGMDFPLWRFNVRTSNTEPVLRLNVESRGNKELMMDKTAELSHMIETPDDVFEQDG